MKTSVSVCLTSLLLLGAMTAAQASNQAEKQLRNDRVAVSKGIQPYDINPFSDSQQRRVTRNDRVRYAQPKVKPDTVSVPQ